MYSATATSSISFSVNTGPQKSRAACSMASESTNAASCEREGARNYHASSAAHTLTPLNCQTGCLRSHN
eukprot:2144600-Pyramimonas_sp.AAC.1